MALILEIKRVSDETKGSQMGSASSPSTVLPHEERSSDEHSTEEESFSKDLTERCPESGSDSGTVVLDLDVNLVDLVDEVGFLRGKVSDEAEILDGFISTISSDQPTR